MTHDLSTAPEADVRAISIYVASLMHGKATTQPVDKAMAAAQAHPTGATLFAGACSACHGFGAPMAEQGRPSLALVSALREDDPGNTIEVILQGMQPPTGANGSYMPAFAPTLTNFQVAEIAAYLRSRYSDRPAWPSLEDAVVAARKEDTQP